MPCKRLTIEEFNNLQNPTGHQTQEKCENFCQPCGDGCYYCASYIYAPLDAGQVTVTGGGTVTFYDPDDPENTNGVNGNYSVDGTYAWDGWIYRLGTDENYLYIDRNDFNIYFYFGNSEPVYQTVDYGPNPSCAPNTVQYGPSVSFPYITLEGSANPSGTWTINGTDKMTCEEAGGVYIPRLGSETNYSACIFYTTVIPPGQDPSYYQCPPPPDPGGNYFHGGGGYVFAVSHNQAYSRCCEAPPPNQECLFEEGRWNGICANGCKDNFGNYLPDCGPDSGKTCYWVSKPYDTVEECEQWRNDAIQWHNNNPDACPFIDVPPCEFYHPNPDFKATYTQWESGYCCDGLCNPPINCSISPC